MKRLIIASLATLACGFSTAAMALPASKAIGTAPDSAVQQVASWQYHQNCGWRNGRWVVDLGGARIVSCRPNRPSRDFTWHREGNREGWYNSHNRAWHYNSW
jgi:hypothetical protein